MSSIGPKKLTFANFLARLFSNLAGGIIGTLVIFAIIVFGSSLLTPEAEKPLSLFLVILLVLLGTICTNLAVSILIGLLDRERYKHYYTLITHVFILNLIIFIFSLPIYFIISNLPALDPKILSIMAAFHLFISIQCSALLMEILSQNEYKIVSIYGVALGVFISFTVIIILYMYGLKIFILFGMAPLLTVSIEIFRSFADLLYGIYYKLYGIDALSSETVLSEGDD